MKDLVIYIEPTTVGACNEDGRRLWRHVDGLGDA